MPYAWDVFGGESWLVELAYASVTGQVAPLTYPTPPTANGSGFIDELAWLYVAPPDRSDYWGTDWTAYRSSRFQNQLAYYATQHPIECAGELGLFGLSAAEVPVPASVPPANIYQAFGVGGRFAAANDGTDQSGGPVITPHYAALAASLKPQEATRLWAWLIERGYFTPLTNVESLSFSTSGPCDASSIQWNSLKGSWNLALQTLGWGRYLAERSGQMPIVWQATQKNVLLQRGYRLLVPDRTSPHPTVTTSSIPATALSTSTATHVPPSVETRSTPAGDRTQNSCEGKPISQWGVPGTYVYRRDNGSSFTVTLKAGESGPRLGVSGPAALSLAGEENVTIALGTFRATLLAANQDYSILTGRLDSVKGHYQRYEWYVCGYGLVKLTSSDTAVKTPGNYASSTTENFELVSFTPLAPDYVRFRQLLADIQSRQIVDHCRGIGTDYQRA